MTEQIGQWILIGIMVMAYALEKALKIVGSKNSKARKQSNPSNTVPGKGLMCIGHENQLGKIETELEFIQKQIDDFKQDTEKNFDVIYGELRKGK